MKEDQIDLPFPSEGLKTGLRYEPKEDEDEKRNRELKAWADERLSKIPQFDEDKKCCEVNVINLTTEDGT